MKQTPYDNRQCYNPQLKHWNNNAYTNTLNKLRIDTKAISVNFGNKGHQGNHLNYAMRKHHCRMGTLFPQFEDTVLIAPEGLNEIPINSNYRER